MTTQGTANRLAQLHWFKSSYSGSGGGDCVEVAIVADTVHVRDSKEWPGGMLRFPADGWAAFVGFAQHL